MKSAGCGCLAHLFCFAEVTGDTLLRRVAIKQLIQPDGTHQSLNGLHPEEYAVSMCPLASWSSMCVFSSPELL